MQDVLGGMRMKKRTFSTESPAAVALAEDWAATNVNCKVHIYMEDYLRAEGSLLVVLLRAKAQ